MNDKEAHCSFLKQPVDVNSGGATRDGCFNNNNNNNCGAIGCQVFVSTAAIAAPSSPVKEARAKTLVH